MIYTIIITIACLLRPCPPGSKCRICEKTGEPYCVNSCACDNGGCPEGQRCVEVANQHCSPGQCCSPVNVSCSGKHIMYECNVW